jgi:hypothetical protein
MAETRTRRPDEDIKIATALAVAMIWMLALAFFAASLFTTWYTGSAYGRQFATLIAMLVLAVTTILMLIFVLPVLIRNYPRRRRSGEPPLFPGLVKGSASAAALTCVLSGLAWLTAKQPFEESAALTLLILSAPVLLIVGAHELIARYVRRR